MRRVQRQFGFPVKLDYQLPPRLVPSHQAIHLLQIAREALSNALKHSQASEVVVTVAQNDNQVKLTVQDNGCGVPEKCHPQQSLRHDNNARPCAKFTRRLPRPPS